MRTKLAVVMVTGCGLVGLAFIGPASATAKTCSAAGAGPACGGGHGNVYSGAFAANLKSGTNRIWSSGFYSVFCSESTLEGEITNGEAGTGAVTGFRFGKCSIPELSLSCTLTTPVSASNPWPISIAKTTAPNGQLAIEGFTLTIVCGELKCTYSAAAGSKGELVVTGGQTAVIDMTNVPLTKETGTSGCGNSTTFAPSFFESERLEYSVTTPDSLYVT